jgi:DHA1 family tetracycline resistance protein-like MFS transporter
VLYAAMVPLAFGNGLLHPSLNALLSRRSRGDEQGGTLGLNQSLSALARVAGPTAGGLLFQTLGIGTPFLAGGAIMLAAAAVARFAVRPQPD